MHRARAAILALGILFSASSASAITIGLTLDYVRDLDAITFTIGLIDSEGQPQSINGYTLAWEFDSSQITLQNGGAVQRVSFGSLGALPFPMDCELAGRCTAGNAPTYDSPAVGDLFSLSFDIVNLGADQLPEFRAGILDPRFDGITQPTGQPIFDVGAPIVVTPEPGTGSLLVLGLFTVAVVGRRPG